MKKLQLILTNPCTQQWDNMAVVGHERYCDSCEKHILDLTNKSDAELLQFFKKKKDNVCGRLLASQLNRELVMPPSKPHWHWLLPLSIGAMFISSAQAQQLKPVAIQKNQARVSTPSSEELTAMPARVMDTIRGQVLNESTGVPLKGVKVKQKGFENVLAITDSTGNFELKISELSLPTKYVFELNGYSKVEASLNDGMVIKLAFLPTIRLGGVSVISTHHQRPLYLVYAGKKSCTIDASKFSEISPNWIEKIDILKDPKATAIYGSRGANGVILVEIKKEFVKKIDFSKQK